MDRYRILRNIASGWIAISVICLFLCGCGEQAPEPPPKPKEVRKKITARPGPAKTGPIAAADVSAPAGVSSPEKPPEEKTGTSESGKTAPGSDKPVSVPVKSADAGKEGKSQPMQAGTAGKTAPVSDKPVSVPVKSADAGKEGKSQPMQAGTAGKTAPVSDKPVSVPVKSADAGKEGKSQPMQAGDKDTKADIPEKDEPKETKTAAAKTDPESGSVEVKKTDAAARSSDTLEEDEEDTIAVAISGMDAEVADKFTALYNPRGKADPFEPLLREESKKTEKRPEPKEEPAVSSKPKPPPRRLTPLEKLDLGQLKLVGIIRAETGNKALVEEASGKGYIIVKGTYIGIHSGIVVDILPDRVVVEEQDEDVLGKVTVRKRELKFNRPEGEDYYEM